MPSAVAAKNIGVGSCLGEKCGSILEAMALIATPQRSLFLYISLKRQEPFRLSQSQSPSPLCADTNKKAQ
jgi:hypothetical protein